MFGELVDGEFGFVIWIIRASILEDPGLRRNGVMTKTLQAVHENGVLHPLEPLLLKEHQRVVVTLSDPVEGWLDQDFIEKVSREVAAMGQAPSLEDVRKSLSKIPGKLSDDIRAEREGR